MSLFASHCLILLLKVQTVLKERQWDTTHEKLFVLTLHSTMIQGTPTQSPWRGSGGVTRGISTTLHSVLSLQSSPRLPGRSQCLTYIWVSSRREETGEMLCQSMWSSWTLLRENTTQHWPRDRERSWSHSQETSINKHTMHMTMILLFSMYTLDNQQPQVEPAHVMMCPHIVPLLIHGEEWVL